MPTAKDAAIGQAINAADAAQKAVVAATSATHKKEYDQFSRLVCNAKKCPAALGPYVMKDKNEVFNAWLASGQNIENVPSLHRFLRSEGARKLLFPVNPAFVCVCASRLF